MFACSYGIKIGDEYKFILHIMNFKNQESFVYICDSSTHSYWESKARLLFKGVMIDFVILNGTVTLIERQKSEILLKLFLLKSNSDSQYVESYTRVLGSCKTDWRISVIIKIAILGLFCARHQISITSLLRMEL